MAHVPGQYIQEYRKGKLVLKKIAEKPTIGRPDRTDNWASAFFDELRIVLFEAFRTQAVTELGVGML
jgi:hypothetical protein